ncbi:MAG: tRNA preQ1(34) S-adenosylmethionine ribosyltransferase-isomerase QueA [Simkania sp.]|nr:tRNA preQ1(34) S-adenosylmethionine ribosyltransferase-isomerase QueA [Simkania sp.]
MKLCDFDFDLPKILIAQEPAQPRGSSRLLHVNQQGELEDRNFSDLLNLLRAGDVMVFNNTKVIPALLRCFKSSHLSTQIDINLLKEISEDTWQAVVSEDTWECAIKSPEKVLDINDELLFSEGLKAVVIDKNTKEKYSILRFNKSGSDLFNTFKNCGKTPLPPYITREEGPSLSDEQSYQTVYAETYGAVAAPTAGLHFTENMLDQIKLLGVQTTFITLHVGAGTFFPVKTENIEDHQMHSESFSLEKETCDLINKAKASGDRIIAVGTTTMRVLESTANNAGFLTPTRGETDIFIREGYKFKIADVLITNFHTPKSTLFMLVCAFSGYASMRQAYAHAISKKYKFFSYGDACYLERNLSHA